MENKNLRGLTAGLQRDLGRQEEEKDEFQKCPLPESEHSGNGRNGGSPWVREGGPALPGTAARWAPSRASARRPAPPAERATLRVALQTCVSAAGYRSILFLKPKLIHNSVTSDDITSSRKSCLRIHISETYIISPLYTSVLTFKKKYIYVIYVFLLKI